MRVASEFRLDLILCTQSMSRVIQDVQGISSASDPDESACQVINGEWVA
jgi:hypothetical protein